MPAPTAPADSSIAPHAIRNRVIARALVRAGDLMPNPLNNRVHPTEQRAAIRGSLDALGWLKDVIVNRTTGHVLDGHARIDDAIARGPDEPVPVAYVELSDEEERLALAILDPMGEMAVRDDDLTARLLEGLEAEDAGLSALLASIAEDAGLVVPEPVEPPAPAELPSTVQAPEPITRRGDIIRLGWHVLMCGDSTDPEDVDRLLGGQAVDLVLTDPPYAIYGSSTGIATDITDDKMVRPFFREILRQSARVLKPFGHCYVCCDWRSYPSWWEVAKGTGIVPKNLIVWDKGGAGLGSMYANTHEFMMFASHRPLRDNMTQKLSGERTVFDANVWRADRVRTSETETREHNAQKPVSLMRRAIENSTEKGGTVLDLFGGAGSTLIGAEQTGRLCYVMEIEPAWCDKIVARWERSTGLVAQRPEVPEVAPNG